MLSLKLTLLGQTDHLCANISAWYMSISLTLEIHLLGGHGAAQESEA